MLASFPSPSSNTIDIGPLTLNWYGVLIAIGVAVAFTLTRRRYEAMGGDGEFADRVSVWAVGVGFLGARAGYVATNTDRFFGADAPLDPWQVIAIWEGGLALFGGLTAGTLTAVWLLRDADLGWRAFGDACAPAIPLAQAIGRWGNYVNQELFGTPTDLPWAVEIDPSRRPAEFADAATFHPTFLYESLWNLVVAAVLLRIDARGRLRRGSLLLLYFGLYSLGRFATELIRTDTDFRLLGLSRNGWISVLVAVAAAVWLARRETDDAARAEEEAADAARVPVGADGDGDEDRPED